MEFSQLIRFKNLFESQLQLASPLTHEPAANPGELHDDIDRASLLQEQILSDSIQKRKAISIASAKAALARIRAGTFGICSECEDEIDLRRLEINPTTVFCIQCQEEEEHQSRLMSTG